MEKLYKSVPLTKPKEQIRLLRWRPQSHQTSTVESVPSYDLVSQDCTRSWPEYVAVSYTWGHTVPLLPIQVNGQVMDVRLNCWYALWQLRHHQATHDLWIDSICVDQSNNTEKSSQVAMMADIYSNAMSVTACIGTEATLLRLETCIAEQDGSLAQDVLDELDHLAYFDRIWIKQEVVLARDISLCCGPSKILWSELETLLALIDTTDAQECTSDVQSYCSYDESAQSSTSALNNSSSGPRASKVRALCARRKSEVQPEASSASELIPLLLSYGASQCTDPRDKIYALLSLLPHDDPGRQINPDYDASNLTVFIHVVLASCKRRSFRSDDTLPVLYKLVNWLKLDLNDAAVLQFIERRRQEIDKLQTSAMKPTSSPPCFDLPILDYHYVGQAHLYEDQTVRLSGYQGFEHHAWLLGEKESTKKCQPTTRVSGTSQDHDPIIPLRSLVITSKLNKKWYTLRANVVLFANDVEIGDALVRVYLYFDENKSYRRANAAYAVLRPSVSTSSKHDFSQHDFRGWAIIVEDGDSDLNSNEGPIHGLELDTCEPLSVDRFVDEERLYITRWFNDTRPSFSETDSCLSLHYEDAAMLIIQGKQASPALADVGCVPANGSYALLTGDHMLWQDRAANFIEMMAKDEDRPWRAVIKNNFRKRVSPGEAH